MIQEGLLDGRRPSGPHPRDPPEGDFLQHQHAGEVQRRAGLPLRHQQGPQARRPGAHPHDHNPPQLHPGPLGSGRQGTRRGGGHRHRGPKQVAHADPERGAGGRVGAGCRAAPRAGRAARMPCPHFSLRAVFARCVQTLMAISWQNAIERATRCRNRGSFAITRVCEKNPHRNAAPLYTKF